MISKSFVCCSLFFVVNAVAGCDGSLVDLAPRPAVSRPRAATAPVFVFALAGRGDVLAAGLDGGLVLWDLSSGATRRVTRIDGLPSDHVAALAFDERAEGLLAATRSGLARGWWEGPWANALIGSTDCDRQFSACTDRPGGGWVAGTTGGLLAAWTVSRLDTLRMPRHAKIVALAHAPRLLDAGEPPLDAPEKIAITPGLLCGLVAATETDGLWVLRSTGARVAWLQLGVCDGLPRGRLRAMVTDSAGRAWIATDAGLACAGPGIAIRSWPSDSLLGRPARALLRAPDGWIYAALADGVVRVDARSEAGGEVPPAERVPGIRGRVLALAWSDGTLWWTDGIRVRSRSGIALELPGPIPRTVCPVWIGQNRNEPADQEPLDRGVPAPPSRTGLRARLARCVRGPRPSLPEPGRSRSPCVVAPPAAAAPPADPAGRPQPDAARALAGSPAGWICRSSRGTAAGARGGAMRFWDSSAIVALVVPEAPSEWVRGLLRDDPVGIFWILSPVEVHSALARRRREGALAAEDFAAARARTQTLFAALSPVVALEEIAERALRVLDLHDLHSADALQLAAALLASRERPRDLPLVTLDARLAEAAEREGFPVEIPRPRL